MTEGPFAFEGLLGEGGSGQVFAARRRSDGAIVAVKVLRPDLVLDVKSTARFLDEAERMSRLSHPSLVRILSAGTLPDGRPYIEMPRLVGRTLAERLASVGPYSLDEGLIAFFEVGQAVAALHQAGMLHRDIKPENVFEEGATGRLILLDLGIARDIDANPSTTTRAGMVRGTPATMAPERFFGSSASVASDVYELALLLFVMVVGRPPWRDDDPSGRMAPRFEGEAERKLGAVGPVLFPCFSMAVAERPASVGVLLGRLRRARGVTGAMLSRDISAPTVVASTVTADASYHVTPASFARQVEASAPADLALEPAPLGPPARASRLRARAVGAIALALGFGGLGVWAAFGRGVTSSSSRLTDGADEAVASVSSDEPAEAPAPTGSLEPTATSSADLSPSTASVALSAPHVPSGISTGPKPIREGTIDEAAVARILHGASFSACSRSSIEGRVRLSFWIDAAGLPTRIQPGPTELAPDRVACLTRVLQNLRFPRPVGGPVNVLFPVSFKSRAEDAPGPSAPAPPPSSAPAAGP